MPRNGRKRNEEVQVENTEATGQEQEATGQEQAAVVTERPQYDENARLTLKQAAAYAGVKPGRIRKLMQGDNPTIHGAHEEIEGTGIKVWRVPFQELEAWVKAQESDSKEPGAKKERRQRTERAEGKRYVLRLTQEQFAKWRPLLEAEGIELAPRYKGRKAKAKPENGSEPEAQEDGEIEAVEVEDVTEVTEPDSDDFEVEDEAAE